jgi:hypothetical protein
VVPATPHYPVSRQVEEAAPLHPANPQASDDPPEDRQQP